MYDKEDGKNGETVNAQDSPFSIYECGKNIYQSTYELVCKVSDSIRDVYMNIETRCQDLFLLVKKYAHYLQKFRNRCKHLDPNDMNFA